MNTNRHGDIVQALADAGFTLPAPPAPLAAYTPALQTGQLAFTSGQLPLVDGKLEATGKVGDGPGLISPDTAREQAARCALNALAALATMLGDLGRIARVAKLTGFVASDPAFTSQSAVIDGASELLKAAFGADGVHTRSAVGVAVLPKDSPVEVELTVALH
ncbi:RidA family protein [Saccharopolyspora hattusasensis]|uniref:RidA family protein n=1 Tax=Saccharopolyspora hattusasensis TaxID=1128679 RepID=UPI003D98E1C9